MEGIGVQLGLRIGRAFPSMGENGLDVDERFDIEARCIAGQRTPARVTQEAIERGHCASGVSIQCEAPSDGVSLNHFTWNSLIGRYLLA